MKFLCVECDRVMEFSEREVPGDGTMAALFRCPGCAREMALLTNPMETRLVSDLGIKVGGRTVPGQPMELVRSTLESGGEGAFADSADPSDGADGSAAAPASPGSVRWSEPAKERLQSVPAFVRGMVKRIYGEWAFEQGIGEITPEIMDRARQELGLEGM